MSLRNGWGSVAGSSPWRRERRIRYEPQSMSDAMTVMDGKARLTTNGSSPYGSAPMGDEESREPTLDETLEELREMAHRKVGSHPRRSARPARGGRDSRGDWALRRAAMEAVLRRCRFGERDGLVVVRAPAASCDRKLRDRTRA